MKGTLVNLARIWGTGTAMLWLTMLGLGVVLGPAFLILWGLGGGHASSEAGQWALLAYGVVCAPFLTYYLGRSFGLRPRLLAVSARNLKA